MRQTTRSVALEVKPESCAHLVSLLDQIREDSTRSGQPGDDAPYAEHLTKIDVLHFLSLSLFPGYDYDPLFVVEVNFDGEPGPFWAELEAAMGERLRDCLRCCKKPLDRWGPLYEAVTAKGSRAPIAPYLEARSIVPSAFHHGNRGLSKLQIRDEFALFEETRSAIAGREGHYRGLDPVGIHAALRETLIARFPWLDTTAPPRIDTWENVGDCAKLVIFAVVLIFVASLPGLLLDLVMPQDRYLVAIALLVAVLGYRFKQIADPLPGIEAQTSFGLGDLLTKSVLFRVVVVAIAYFVVAGGVGTALSMVLTGNGAWEAGTDTIARLLWGLLGIPVTALGVLVWLRTLERGDSSQSAPPVDPRLLREMARREDRIPQNHMGSIVLVKPGVLRAILIRVGHMGVNLLLRVTARSGYLGSMRTIHFAHWALVDNKSRLMFFSNFDQTWESYLDDFIEKAHVGLTIAWSCGVGFPPARFLAFEGATRGRQFKEWARHSMAVSHFWYSAYKDLTTDQIERNHRIALGLRRAVLTEKEAAAWIVDL